MLESDLTLIREQIRPLFSELKGKRILLTGATGFFGKWLLATFDDLNKNENLEIKVIALSRSPKNFLKKWTEFRGLSGITYVEADLSSLNGPFPELDYVIHTATDASFLQKQNEPLLVFESAFLNTRNLLSKLPGTGVKRVLFTSSGAVYGRQPTELPLLSEDFSGAPDSTLVSSAYGEGKRASELLGVLESKKTGFDFIIARCFAYIGPYLPMDGHFAAGNFLRDALNGGPIVVQGDGSAFRSYLYPTDLVIGLLTLLIRGKASRAYNLGSDLAVDIETLARTIAKLSGGLEVKIEKKRNSDVRPERYVPSIERVRDELSFHATISLEDAVKRSLLFLKSTFKD